MDTAAIAGEPWRRPRNSAAAAVGRGSPSLTPGGSGADIPTMAISTPDLGRLRPTRDPNDPYEWRPRRRVLPWIAAVVAVALIAVAVVVASGSNDKPTARLLEGQARRSDDDAVGAHLQVARGGRAPRQRRRRRRAGHRARVPRQDVGPGTILDQFPRAGHERPRRRDARRSRVPDKVPDFVGKGVNAARATFSMLNVKLTVEDALDARASPTEPCWSRHRRPERRSPRTCASPWRAGRSRPTSATSTVSARCPTKTETATIAGTAYPDSLRWNVSVCPGAPPLTVSYLLAGHYRKLIATAGLGAGGDPADRVHLDIAVDGTVLGEPRPRSRRSIGADRLDLIGRQQLALTFTPIDGGDPKCADAHAIMGQAWCCRLRKVADATRGYRNRSSAAASASASR